LANNNFYDKDNEFIPIDKYLKPYEERKNEESLEKKIVSSPGEIDKSEDKGFLKEILTDKISFLKQFLSEIDEQIHDRENLKDKILDKIDKGMCYLHTKLYEIETWGLGRNKNIDTRRTQIEKELEALKSQKRDETRESWRDISLLKKEHREFFHEYRNALRRVKVIFPEKSRDKTDINIHEK